MSETASPGALDTRRSIPGTTTGYDRRDGVEYLESGDHV